MNKPLISLVVPCYGVEKYLDRCMESLTSQTIGDIEIILVDDKSPDGSPELCDLWAAKDARVKVVHKEKNEGLGFARNTGLDHASGEYVAFVDSDDFVETDMYEKLYAVSKEQNADVVFCGMKSERKDGSWAVCHEVNELKVLTGDEVRTVMLDMIASAPYDPVERHYRMSVWHAIYRRSIIEEHHIRFESERVVVSEDLPFQVDYLINAGKVAFIPDALYCYCRNGSSLTSTFKPEKFEGHKRMHALLSDKLSGIEGAYLRVDRFFIGYNRRHILNMISSGLKGSERKRLLEPIVNDDIWNGISQRYRKEYLSAYPRIFYKLTTDKRINLLMLYSALIHRMEKILK